MASITGMTREQNEVEHGHPAATELLLDVAQLTTLWRARGSAVHEVYILFTPIRICQRRCLGRLRLRCCLHAKRLNVTASLCIDVFLTSRLD